MKSLAWKIILTALLFSNVTSPLLVAGDWKCILYGDTRNNTTAHKQVLAAMKRDAPTAKFIINVGDVVDYGYTESQWIDWQNSCNTYLGGTGQDSLPPRYMSAPGNHDQLLNTTAMDLWQKYLPGQSQRYGNQGKFFTFDYEDARFIILDSEFSPRETEQYQMLVKALEVNPPKWIIAVWHAPLFSYGEKSYQDALNKLWGTILYQRGCDIIATGDAHYYVRTKKVQLTGDKYPPLNPTNGVTVLVTGNGGASIDVPNYSYDGNSYMIDQYARTNQDFGFTELRFQDSILTLRHIFRTGIVFDQITLRPNPKYATPTSVAGEAGLVPGQLRQNYPNPFNSSTSIRFTVTDESAVDILIYDLNGRLVRTLVEQMALARGEHQMQWDGRDDNSCLLPSGVYFVRMRGITHTQPIKMIMLK